MLLTSGALRFKTQSSAPEQTSDRQTQIQLRVKPHPVDILILGHSPGLGVQCPVACVQISAGAPIELSFEFRESFHNIRKMPTSTTAFYWLNALK